MGLITTNYRCPKCGHDEEINNNTLKAIDTTSMPCPKGCKKIVTIEEKEVEIDVYLLKFDFKNNSQKWKWND